MRIAHDPIDVALDRSVHLPSPVRIAAGALVSICGLVLVTMGLFCLVPQLGHDLPHPIAADVLGIGLGAFGGVVLYVGWCVLAARRIGRSVQVAFALMFGIAAIGTMVQAWQTDSTARAATAIGEGFCAFLFVRSVVRK
jgi:hypothetical protein